MKAIHHCDSQGEVAQPDPAVTLATAMVSAALHPYGLAATVLHPQPVTSLCISLVSGWAMLRLAALCGYAL